MLSNLVLMWYAAIAPAFGRWFSGVSLALFAVAGESFGQYQEGVFIVLALALFLYTDVLHVILRESGARSLMLYTMGAVTLYVVGLALAQTLSGTAIRPLLVLFFLSEMIVGAAIIQAIARPERILYARHESYAKVEEVFRL